MYTFLKPPHFVSYKYTLSMVKEYQCSLKKNNNWGGGGGGGLTGRIHYLQPKRIAVHVDLHVYCTDKWERDKITSVIGVQWAQ